MKYSSETKISDEEIEVLDDIETLDLPNDTNTQNITPTTSSDKPIDIKEEYLKAYIGPKYESFQKQKFSIWTLIFGMYYFLYRKIWLWAFVYFIINLIELNFPYYIALIVSIIFAFKFTSIYKNDVLNNITKILTENPHAHDEKIIELCQKRGKPNLLIPLLTAIIIFISTFIIILSYYSNDIHKYLTRSNTFNNLEFKLPKNFELNEISDDEFKYYSYSKDNLECDFQIETSDYSNSADDLLKSKLYYLDTIPTIKNKKINNYTWRHLTIKNKNTTEHYYATEYDELIYAINFTEKKNDKCLTKYNELLNSLNFIKPKL